MTVSVQRKCQKTRRVESLGLPSAVHIPLPKDSPHRQVLEDGAELPGSQKSSARNRSAGRNSLGRLNGAASCGFSTRIGILWVGRENLLYVRAARSPATFVVGIAGDKRQRHRGLGGKTICSAPRSTFAQEFAS